MTVEEVNKKLRDLGYYHFYMCDKSYNYGICNKRHGMWPDLSNPGYWKGFKTVKESAKYIEKMLGIKIIEEANKC